MNRVDLVKGYAIDMTSMGMVLKDKIKMSISAKGEEVENSNVHGYFTSWKSLFNKLHRLLVIDKLGEKSELKQLILAVKESDAEINKICEVLEGNYNLPKNEWSGGNEEENEIDE